VAGSVASRPRCVARLVAVAAMVTVAAGCATIPDTGPVRPGAAVLAEGEDPIIRVVARPPTTGMGPSEIVRGFLAASASSEGDHAVARQYLAPATDTSWEPDRRVLVYDQNVGVTLHEPARDRVLARARVMGELDVRGAYTPLPATPRTAAFHLRRVAGEWRIDRLPQGLLLTQLDIERSYRAVDLYFLNAPGSVLVPDPIFLPVVQPGLSTRLVQALLDGPTPWLAPAVATAFPAGTRLVVDSVPVENGVAHVDLSSGVLDATATQREQLAAQLVWTLSELPDVNSVSITVQGQSFPVGDPAGNETMQDWATFDPDALPESASGYVLTRTGLNRLFGAKLQPVEGAMGTAGSSIVDPAVSVDATTIAALSADRRTAFVQRIEHPQQLVPVLSGADLGQPSFDSTGLLWLVDRTTHGSTFTVILPDGGRRPVAAPGLEQRHVEALALSRDGTRVAVVVTDKGRGRLLLGRVQRFTAPDEPTRLVRVTVTGLRPVEHALDDVRDVSWADADHVVVLARAPGAVRQPYSVAIDATLHQVGGALPGLVGIAAAPDRPLLGATRDEQVWQDAGVGWRLVGRGTYAIYPG